MYKKFLNILVAGIILISFETKVEAIIIDTLASAGVQVTNFNASPFLISTDIQSNPTSASAMVADANDPNDSISSTMLIKWVYSHLKVSSLRNVLNNDILPFLCYRATIRGR